MRVVVANAPGITGDILARLLGQWLSERLGQPFVIENRPGGGNNIGTEAVVRAPADGYTLLLVAPPNAITATLYDKLNFNFVRDIAPVASISREPYVMLVNRSVSAKTIPELIAYAKANPGKLNMASSGNGTASHMAGELFKMMAGVDLVHVPYRGSAPALTDLIGGQVQVMFTSTASSIDTSGPAGSPAGGDNFGALGDVAGHPDRGRICAGLRGERIFWRWAPRNTPAEIVAKLNEEINAGLADPKMKERLTAPGGTILAGSPADFGRLIAKKTEKWAKVIRFWV